MKRLLIAFFILLTGVSAAYSEDTMSSDIKEVTLFSDQALVKREAVVKVAKGLNELLVELEAYHIDKDSVSAKVFGEGELFSVQYKEIFLKEMPQENIRELERKIEALRDSVKVMQDKKAALADQKRFIESVIDFSKTQVPEEIKTSFPKTEDLEAALVFIDKNLTEISRKQQSLDIQIRDIRKEIKVLEKELSSLRGYSQKSKKVIEILFNSKREQQVKIEASYLTYNASWAPLYKVDVPLDLKDIGLVMFAKIQQKTGEDWKNIKLSISNVIPLEGVGLPTLSSWELDIIRPRKAARQYGVYEKAALMEEAEYCADVSGGDFAAYSAPFKEEAEFVFAQKKEMPFSFEYELPQVISIASKDKETILPLFSKDIKGEFFHYAVPRVTPLTFLACKASSDKELLSGMLNVYFGGRFIGKTYVDEKRAGEEFYLSLGADREVKIKREKIKDKVQETFFRKIQRQTIIREMAFKITIESLKDEAVKVRLIDNIPVSRTDKIEVKSLKITPEPKEKDYQDQEGVMLWEFDLKPKEKKEIDIEFTITYPKDTKISGI